MKLYKECKEEIEFLERYRKDKTIQEIINNLKQQLESLGKTANVEIEFAILEEGYKPSDEEIIKLAQELSELKKENKK